MSLLDEVKKAALPAVWAQGQRLARAGKVSLERRTPDDAVLRMAGVAGEVAPTVVLYPDTGEWSCDCDSKVDPCIHVAAATVALMEGSATQKTPEKPSLVTYRIGRDAGRITLHRSILKPDGSLVPLTTPLAAATASHPELRPIEEDALIDKLLAGRRPGFLPDDKVTLVFQALSRSSHVMFEERPISVSSDPVSPRGFVRDIQDGVELVFEQDPTISELPFAGYAITGNVLRPLGATDISGARLERLPVTRFYKPTELGDFVTRVLPDLETRIAMTIQSKRLPRRERNLVPRIDFTLEQEGSVLYVLPQLVYGNPPVARIENGRLVSLSAVVPRRDEVAEKERLEGLRNELSLVPGRRVRFDGAEAVRFATKLDRFREEAGESGRLTVSNRAVLLPQLSARVDGFDLTFQVQQEGSREKPRPVSAEAVVMAWQEGLPLVPLRDGGFAPLPSAFLEKHGDLLADLLEARRSDGTVTKAVLPRLAELCEALESPAPPSLTKLRPLLAGHEGIPSATLPNDLTATLRPYQRVGVDWLCLLRDAGLGGILADDMGLGKTLEALASLRGRSLVVCPRSVVHNWAAEINKFRPGLKIGLYHGPSRALDAEADITLTTYALLRNDAEKLSAVHWDNIVLDEAQTIKNPDSQVTKAAFGLRGSFCLALSGTPVENRLDDLWSQMAFANRGLLGNRQAFKKRFEEPISAGDEAAGERLRRLVGPFVLRRHKRDVLPDLPALTESVLYCELDDNERALYDAVRASTQKEIVTQLREGLSVLAALEALLRLRQASCHRALVPGQSATTSAKTERLIDALTDAAADGHRALVFSQWTSFLDLIEPALGEANLPFVRLDGSTRDRESVVAAFQDPKGPPVMLVSLKAGGTGLNLTAADHVFLLDPWWNPAVEEQAFARAHRIGQDKPVMVYRLVAKDTVEERILALQEKKKHLAEVALGAGRVGETGFGISRDELLALLE